MRLGERLVALRRAAGLSQGDVSRRTGIAQQYLSLLETGKNDNLGGAHALRLARALGTTADYLLGGDDPDQRAAAPARGWNGADRRAALRETYRALLHQEPNIDEQTLAWLDRQFASFVEQVGEDRRRVRKMAERSALDSGVEGANIAHLADGDVKEV